MADSTRAGRGDDATVPIADLSTCASAAQAPRMSQDTAEVVSTPESGSQRKVFTCGGCPARWTLLRRAHCSGEKSVAVDLAAWGGDPRILADGDAHLHECPVDRGGVLAEAFANLVRAEPRRVRTSSLNPPSRVAMNRLVLGAREWSQVLWSVVGPVPVDVVNVLFFGDPAVEDAVFVGLDVLEPADSPPQADVSMGGRVAVRLVRRDLLAGFKPASGDSIAGISARPAELPLPGASDQLSTRGAGLGLHGAILHVRALCHRTFTGVTAFDQHRVGGACAVPAAVGLVEREPGLWGAPPMPPEVAAKLRAAGGVR